MVNTIHKNHSPLDTEYALLSLTARINPVTADMTAIQHSFAEISDWKPLVTGAENHGIAPLLYTSLHASGINLPQEIKRQLYALVQRHKWANHARAEALIEIATACKEQSIQLIVLKGSYLAHSIYPDPSLRTMSDIDLLAPPDRAQDVQEILRDLGYNVPQQAGSQYMSKHHHLPGAQIMRDGISILVEVHHDALSGDAPASITTENLTVEPNSYKIGDNNLLSLGHQDQLRHLYHHMSEPASRLKLIWCVDIVYYASHFEAEIDWQSLKNHYPKVLNALQLIDYIIPLPENLQAHIPTNTVPMPKNTGESILPLTTILREPLKQRLSDLLSPSSWWLRLYYGVAPENSLFLTRCLSHPMQVIYWVYRRLHASQN